MLSPVKLLKPGTLTWQWRRPRWWDLARQVVARLDRHNSALLAAGIAMYGLLSVFPGLAAAVLIYGVFATPSSISLHMRVFAGVLPPGVWQIFNAQLHNVAAHQHGTLTVAAATGALIALWSARLAMSALMTATDIAYAIRERRGYFLEMLISMLLTLGSIVGFLLMLVVGVIVPLALALLGSGFWITLAVTVLRWLVLWVFAVVGLALLYHYAPARRVAHWRCLTWGSVGAASVWLVLSAIFSLYVRFFGSYDKTYGALAGVIVLLMWFYLLSFTVVAGAELNAVRDGRARAARNGRAGQSDHASSRSSRRIGSERNRTPVA
jgi:membrane protein